MWKRFLRRLGFVAPVATPIRELRPGGVHCIEGVALALGPPLPAPFTGTPSATMTILQSEFVENSQGNGRMWRTTNDVDFGQTFYVRDETGVVRIDRKGWSVLKAPRTSAQRIPPQHHEKSLARFQDFHRDTLELGLLARAGLRQDIPHVRNYEIVIPHERRIRVIGVVGATGEPMPTGTRMPLVATGFRDSPSLLELAPESKKMRIELLPN